MQIKVTILLEEYTVVTEPKTLPAIRDLIKRAVTSTPEDRVTGDLDYSNYEKELLQEAEEATMFEVEVEENWVTVTLPSGKHARVNLEDALQFLVAAGIALIHI